MAEPLSDLGRQLTGMADQLKNLATIADTQASGRQIDDSPKARPLLDEETLSRVWKEGPPLSRNGITEQAQEWSRLREIQRAKVPRRSARIKAGRTAPPPTLGKRLYYDSSDDEESSDEPGEEEASKKSCVEEDDSVLLSESEEGSQGTVQEDVKASSVDVMEENDDTGATLDDDDSSADEYDSDEEDNLEEEVALLGFDKILWKEFGVTSWGEAYIPEEDDWEEEPEDKDKEKPQYTGFPCDRCDWLREKDQNPEDPEWGRTTEANMPDESDPEEEYEEDVEEESDTEENEKYYQGIRTLHTWGGTHPRWGVADPLPLELLQEEDDDDEEEDPDYEYDGDADAVIEEGDATKASKVLELAVQFAAHGYQETPATTTARLDEALEKHQEAFLLGAYFQQCHPQAQEVYESIACSGNKQERESRRAESAASASSSSSQEHEADEEGSDDEDEGPSDDEDEDGNKENPIVLE